MLLFGSMFQSKTWLWMIFGYNLFYGGDLWFSFQCRSPICKTTQNYQQQQHLHVQAFVVQPHLIHILRPYAKHASSLALVPTTTTTTTTTTTKATNTLQRCRRKTRPLGSALWAAAAGVSNPNLAVQVAQRVQPYVVLVTPRGVRNMTARGSGFLLDEPEWLGRVRNSPNATTHMDDKEDVDVTSNPPGTYLITAAHVAVPGYSIEVTTTFLSTTTTTASNGAPQKTKNVHQHTFPVTVVARNTTLDLALLWTQEDLWSQLSSDHVEDDTSILQRGLQLSKEAPSVGTLAFAHGYPASRLRGPAMTSGIVCGIADGLGMPDTLPGGGWNNRRGNGTDNNNDPPTTSDATVFVVTDAAMSGGMSGGPLVDSQGTVLGVNALIRPDLRALGNYAVSSVEVLAFLQSITEKMPQNASSSSSSSSLYQVWLYNDPMNKKERVSRILKDIGGLKDDDLAEQVMMQAHTQGRGMVGNFTTRSQAESLVQSLRDQDLLVEME